MWTLVERFYSVNKYYFVRFRWEPSVENNLMYPVLGNDKLIPK